MVTFANEYPFYYNQNPSQSHFGFECELPFLLVNI